MSPNKTKVFNGDPRIPAGSWVQHVHAEGYMFWRNNNTGEITRDLWFSPWATTPPAQRCCHRVPVQHHHLVSASFAPIAQGNRDSSPPRKATEGKGKSKEREMTKIPSTWFCQPWQEIYHPVTGKKHWRHRDTGEERNGDPLW
ncbi:unnamed protein product [Hapterophycus canaliculatus]